MWHPAAYRRNCRRYLRGRRNSNAAGVEPVNFADLVRLVEEERSVSKPIVSAASVCAAPLAIDATRTRMRLPKVLKERNNVRPDRTGTRADPIRIHDIRTHHLPRDH